MKKSLLLLILTGFLIMPAAAFGAEINKKIAGRILLQIQENGQAWYINPDNNQRYLLGRPENALGIMKKLSLGITNNDLNKLPLGYIDLPGRDTDNDGLINEFEEAIGTNIYCDDTDNDGYTDKEEILNGYSPLKANNAKQIIDVKLQQRLAGKILLQVQSQGEAWYVNPADGQRYFLSRPAHALITMRQLGLGATNSDIAKFKEFISSPVIKDTISKSRPRLFLNN